MNDSDKLPCDVLLPPATVIRKGCEFSALLAGLQARTTLPPDECRFNDPAAVVRAAFSGGYTIPPPLPLHVTGADYEYDGTLRGLITKSSGAVRYVVEDGNSRLFIHNAKQIGKEDGWTP
jgi:hypothetical protein